jgi:hypothetical protein
LTARTADKHHLYQLSVQAPEEDSRFFARQFQRLAGRPLRLFREDFCGTALLSCHVVKSHRERRALGVDLHGPTLAWGRRHNVSQLTADQRARLELRQGDVRDVRRPRADLIAALNFSYCVFKTRAEMRAYFVNARRALVGDGVLMVDAWGGSETQNEQEEYRSVSAGRGQRFTYVWDQARFDPLTYHTTCKIHFEFERGPRMRNAFVYDWRLWSLPELQELMDEAGFADVHVLWEGTDHATDEGNGVFRRVTRGAADPSWIAYVVGRPGR